VAERAAGVLVRVGPDAHFIPASVAVHVAPAPLITPVPGSPSEFVGVALYEGAIVPVLAVGPARREMVVCRWAGELVGLVGGDAFEAGLFEVAADSPGSIEQAGQRYPVLDVPALCAAVQRAARREPWAG
jgi:hypothetical protein